MTIARVHPKLAVDQYLELGELYEKLTELERQIWSPLPTFISSVFYAAIVKYGADGLYQKSSYKIIADKKFSHLGENKNWQVVLNNYGLCAGENWISNSAQLQYFIENDKRSFYTYTNLPSIFRQKCYDSFNPLTHLTAQYIEYLDLSPTAFRQHLILLAALTIPLLKLCLEMLLNIKKTSFNVYLKNKVQWSHTEIKRDLIQRSEIAKERLAQVVFISRIFALSILTLFAYVIATLDLKDTEEYFSLFLTVLTSSSLLTALINAKQDIIHYYHTNKKQRALKGKAKLIQELFSVNDLKVEIEICKSGNNSYFLLTIDHQKISTKILFNILYMTLDSYNITFRRSKELGTLSIAENFSITDQQLEEFQNRLQNRISNFINVSEVIEQYGKLATAMGVKHQIQRQFENDEYIASITMHIPAQFREIAAQFIDFNPNSVEGTSKCKKPLSHEVVESYLQAIEAVNPVTDKRSEAGILYAPTPIESKHFSRGKRSNSTGSLPPVSHEPRLLKMPDDMFQEYEEYYEKKVYYNAHSFHKFRLMKAVCSQIPDPATRERVEKTFKGAGKLDVQVLKNKVQAEMRLMGSDYRIFGTLNHRDNTYELNRYERGLH